MQQVAAKNKKTMSGVVKRVDMLCFVGCTRTGMQGEPTGDVMLVVDRGLALQSATNPIPSSLLVIFSTSFTPSANFIYGRHISIITEMERIGVMLKINLLIDEIAQSFQILFHQEC